MNKVLYNSANVKMDIGKNYEFLSYLVPDSRFYKYETLDKVCPPIPNVMDSLKPQKNCKAGCSQFLVVSPESAQESEEKKEKIDEDKLNFIAIAKERAFTDTELKHAADWIVRKCGMLWVEISPEVRKLIPSNNKGSARYMYKTCRDVIDATEAICTEDRDIYFWTPEVWTKLYENRFVAWNNFREDEVMPILEHLRKHHHCWFVLVMESTAKGFPHAHVVLSFPKGEFKFDRRKKGGTPVRFGKLFDIFKKRCYSPRIDLRWAKGKNTKNYLAKYVTKGTENTLGKIAKKEGSLTDKERKTVMGLLYTSLVNKRMWSATRKARIKEDKEKQRLSEEEEKQLETFKSYILNQLYSGVVSGSDLARLRAYLVKNVIIRRLPCARYIGIMKQWHYDELFDVPPNKLEQDAPEIRDLIEKNTKRISCNGCFYSHLWNYIENGKDIVFSFFEGDIFDIPEIPFDLSHVEDSESLEWFVKFYTALYWCLYSMCVEHMSFSEIYEWASRQNQE